MVTRQADQRPPRPGFAEGALRWARGRRDAGAERATAASAPTQAAEPAQAHDVALAALLLGAAMQGHDATALAARLIGRFGSFAALLSAPDAELRGISGLGTHGLAAIRLLQEAALRMARASVQGQPVLADPVRLRAYLASVLSREKVEQFHILFLDGQGRLIADEAQARGTVNHTPVYPREVVRRALDLGADGLILVHNHPTGDPTPSAEDLAMTRMVSEACALLGVAVLDHVIVGTGRFTHFSEQGLLPR